MLRYTGHPFVDVGVATVTAFAGKQNPASVTLKDLEAMADYLKDTYCHIKTVQNYISTIFMNSHFVQQTKEKEDKQAYANKVLYAFRDDVPTIDGVNCVFFPHLPAVLYAHRQYIPLLNGNNIRNFSPFGESGIPVSGLALLAIHAMPLGCIKCRNLLAFHQMPFLEDRTDMTLVLARTALEANKKAIHNMHLQSDIEMPNYGGYKKTRYVEAVLAAQQSGQRRRANLANITGYYFTNYGPKPDLEIIRLDNAVLDFVDTVQQDTAKSWRQAVYACWQRPKDEQDTPIDNSNILSWRNRLYEALFDLPSRTRSFIKHLTHGRDWQLIEIFLRKVLFMDKTRIDVYRELGDHLAGYMLTYEGDSLGFYYKFSRAKDYEALRRVIRSAAERMLKKGQGDPIFTYDKFILAFEHPSEGYSQWRLARDLISFRMLEILHQSGMNTSDIADDIDEEEEKG